MSDGAPVAAPASDAAPVAETPAAPEVAAPVAEAPKQQPPVTRRIKVNGREVEVPEAELIEAGATAAQIRRAANERFESAQKLVAQHKALQDRIASDPESVLAEMMGGGDKLRALAEQVLIKQMRSEQLTPEQRAYEKLKAEHAAAQKQIQEIEDSKKTAESEVATQKARAYFDAQFGEALKAEGLPRTTDTIRRMAHLTQKAIDNGLDVTVGQIAKMVRADQVEEQARTISGLDGDALLAALGPELLKRIRAADVAKVRGAATKPAAPAKPAAQADEPEKTSNPHLLSSEEWHKRYDDP